MSIRAVGLVLVASENRGSFDILGGDCIECAVI